MSHIRSGFNGVSVPIGSAGSSHNTITNNVIINKEKEKKEGVEEVSEGIYVVYPPNPTQERDLKSAQDRLNEIKAAQPNNDRLIKRQLIVCQFIKQISHFDK